MMALTRLIIMDPGTIQSHPDMGLGLVSRFRYSIDLTETDLILELRRQIDKFLPKLQGAKIQVQFKDKVIFIAITVDGNMYNFQYDISSGNGKDLKTQIISLNDL